MKLDYLVINGRLLESSSILAQSGDTRWAWLTLIAEAQANDGVIPTLTAWHLSQLAKISLPAAQAAMQTFLSPDPYSGDPTDEGRRLQPTGRPNEYRLTSWEKHQDLIRRSGEAAKKRRQRYAGQQGIQVDASPSVPPPILTPSPTPIPQNPERDRAGAPHGAENRPPPDPWPGQADAAVIGAAGRLRDQIDASPLKQKPTDQILIALVTSYGEALIVETLADCGGELAGKGWKYLEAILQSRKERPNERPGRRRSGSAPSQPANGARRLSAAELGMRTGEDALRELAAKRNVPKV